MLGRQPWSFAGDSGRASVSQLFLDPCIHFKIDTNWFLLTYMILTTNWQADSIKCWTVSLGGGVGKLFTIGSQAINVRTESYYNVEKPDSAPDWQ